ncbi:hypothetical protein DK058_24400 [Salmonella enterica subsp. enterica serovar Typhi]|nr:hypothetical protein [Salmonella enterica subsp. enterica]EBU7498025.1 hypothetical protein [Salmonella enterica subsp. enterica serovar Typhi]EBW2353180.1 hypothetical protein [Salmonella enterica subsp. enterica serovar Enteritidis]EBY6940113.1 hypothetical protein [Salmonella enterica subsp. enterica serovar Newport]
MTMPSDVALPASSLPAKKGFWYGMRQQARIITALLVRETATRFGKRSGGFVWAFIEPAGYIAFFLVLHGVVRQQVPYGENAMVFFVAGLLCFRLYTSMAGKMMPALSSNQTLLSYPMVRPLDPIIARALLEAVVMLVIAGIVIAFLSFYLQRTVLLNQKMFLFGVGVTVYLGFAMGTFNAVFSTLVPAWSSVMSMLAMPLLLMSGILYVPAAMPPEVLAVITWNPILHCVEIMRAGFYVDYLTVAEPAYPIAFATLVLTAALSIERLYRNRILHQ